MLLPWRALPILDHNLFLRQVLQGCLTAIDCGSAILQAMPWLTTAIQVACMTSFASGPRLSLRTRFWATPQSLACREPHTGGASASERPALTEENAVTLYLRFRGLQRAVLDQAGRRLRKFDAVPRHGPPSMRRHGSILVRTPSEEVRSSPFRL